MSLKFSVKITAGAAETIFVVIAKPEANTAIAPIKAHTARDDEERPNMHKSYS
jgi:hypothetical protein